MVAARPFYHSMRCTSSQPDNVGIVTGSNNRIWIICPATPVAVVSWPAWAMINDGSLCSNCGMRALNSYFALKYASSEWPYNVVSSSNCSRPICVLIRLLLKQKQKKLSAQWFADFMGIPQVHCKCAGRIAVDKNNCASAPPSLWCLAQNYRQVWITHFYPSCRHSREIENRE